MGVPMVFMGLLVRLKMPLKHNKKIKRVFYFCIRVLYYGIIRLTVTR